MTPKPQRVVGILPCTAAELPDLREVLATSPFVLTHPLLRNLVGEPTSLRRDQVPIRRLLMTEEEKMSEWASGTSALPYKPQLYMVKMRKEEMAELIEQHRGFTRDGRLVRLQDHYVRQYMRQRNSGFVVRAIAPVPVVLPDGALLGGNGRSGIDPSTGIWFDVDKELDRYLPAPEACTLEAVAQAMHFLVDEWLVDVLADYQGKCTLIALALTIVEKMLLPARPAFFIVSGRRGGGKTTVVNMIANAVLGSSVAVAAYSTIEEERRKALFAYLGTGVSLLLWDNIARGTTVASPAIEKSLTNETYSDRRLGVSDVGEVPAYTVQVYTGNNIAPRGDTASRSLIVRIYVSRPDPENRDFARPGDPLRWTRLHRGQILHSLYTILLGNPRRRQQEGGDDEGVPTRFKEWWDLIGSAVEYAAECHGKEAGRVGYMVGCEPALVDFYRAFSVSDAGDEESNALGQLLVVFREKWPQGATAREVAIYARDEEEADAVEFLSMLETASGSRRPLKRVTAPVVTARLKAVAEAPIQVGEEVLMLRHAPAASHKSAALFAVDSVPQQATTEM
jgi:hypothetical protein